MIYKLIQKKKAINKLNLACDPYTNTKVKLFSRNKNIYTFHVSSSLDTEALIDIT